MPAPNYESYQYGWKMKLENLYNETDVVIFPSTVSSK